MTKLVLLLVSITSSLWAQGRGGPPPPPLASPDVSFDRILKANQEPQNWLTYGGSPTSQRHSLVTQITPGNAQNPGLKWVFQSKSIGEHESTPPGGEGVMNPIQSPHQRIR